MLLKFRYVHNFYNLRVVSICVVNNYCFPKNRKFFTNRQRCVQYRLATAISHWATSALGSRDPLKSDMVAAFYSR